MLCKFLTCYGIPTGIPSILGKALGFSVKSSEKPKAFPEEHANCCG